MTFNEATLLSNFLDKVLPGTEYRQVMVSMPPPNGVIGAQENDWGIHIAEEDAHHGIVALYECKTFEEVYDYMKVKTAMRTFSS